MRPRLLSEVIGQSHLTSPGMPLSRLLSEGEAGTRPASVVLWGPPGTGKTTLAMLAASVSGRRFAELSAVTAGVKEVRAEIDAARREEELYGRGTVLFIDEVHRFSKAQQDALLPAVENGWVTLIAATTENPSFSVIAPLLSRSLLLKLKPLEKTDLAAVLNHAVTDSRGLAGAVALADEATAALLAYADGDARRALTALEAAAALAQMEGSAVLNEEHVRRAAAHAGVRYDRDGDQHYDIVSAFIKSLRGSDVDAALHYLARMIVAGEDPRFIARRLIVHASEDVGMADPGALSTAVNAAQAVALIGMPEAKVVLAHATIHVALAPKSNAVSSAVEGAIADVESGLLGAVPPHLRDAHYQGAERLGHGTGYRYPHDHPGAVVEQQYPPTPVLARRYYHPSGRGAEEQYGAWHEKVRAIVRGEVPTHPPTSGDEAR